MSFFSWLFDTSGFVPRSDCGDWTAVLMWTHVASDALIFFAYMSIPASLAYLAIVKKRDLPFTPLFWFFAAFIFFCGTTHAVEAGMFWSPQYRLNGILKACTAVVSWITVIALVRVMPKALSLPGIIKMNDQLHTEIEERRIVAEELDRARTDLESRVKERTSALEAEVAMHKSTLTALRLTEEKLRGIHRELEGYIVQRTSELVKANEKVTKLAAIVESSRDAIISQTMDGRVISWNPGAEAMYGYTAAEVVGGPVDVIIPQGSKTFSDGMDAARRGENVLHSESRRRSKTGAVLDVSLTISPIRDANGKVYALSTIERDITEQRRAERLLADQLQLNKAITTSIREAIIAVDREGRVTFMNPAAEEMAGYSREDFAQDDAIAKLGIRNSAGSALALGEIRAASLSGDATITTSKGAPLPVALMSSPLLEDGRPGGSVLTFHDITARRTAEELLKENERRFRGTFENAAVGIAHVDSEARWVHVNPKFCAIMGYTREELLTMAFPEATHPDDIVAEMRLFDSVMRGEMESYTLEKRYFHKNGSIVWANTTKSLQRDSDGTPQHCIAVVEDISERKRLEVEVRQRAEELSQLWQTQNETLGFLDSLLANAPVGFAFFDREHRFVRVNDFLAESLSGASVEDHLGRTLLEVMGSRAPSVETMIDRVFETRESLREIEVSGQTPQAPGIVRNWLISFYPVVTAGGAIPWVGIIASEITVLKQAERALRVNRERLDLVIRAAELGVWFCDLPFNELQWNEKCKEHFGLPPDALVTIESFFERLHPEDVESTRHGIDQSIATNSPFDMIYRTISPQGRMRFIRAIGAPFVDEQGIPRRFDGVTIDMTERKRAEEELIEANRELESFAFIASHDLKAPLRAISGYIQLLDRRLSDTIGPEERKFITGAVESAEQMTLLINDLLAFSRVHRADRDFQEVGLDRVVTRALANLRLDIQDSGAEIITGDLPSVYADETMLMQLFQNLIGNAIKFKGDEPPKVWVEARRREIDWIISVRDNGIGIDPKYHERIFDIFKRLHSSNHYPGTGIGLAICKKIADRHHGKIWVESEKGKGAAFFMTLPIKEDISR
ncbi:hypothetical protein BH09SUM1_BH09SUM1_25250 [soil metagenome]